MVQSKIFLISVVAAIILLLLSLGQEMNRRWQYHQEVKRLEQEVQHLERETVALEHLNEYFATDEYQERLAREQLNYSAPGEKVVLIPHDQIVEHKQDLDKSEEQTASVPLLWWRAFFD